MHGLDRRFNSASACAPLSLSPWTIRLFHSGCESGNSSRECAPLVSSRISADIRSALATEHRLESSALDRSTASPASLLATSETEREADSSDAAVRLTPAPSVIARCTRARILTVSCGPPTSAAAVVLEDPSFHPGARHLGACRLAAKHRFHHARGLGARAAGSERLCHPGAEHHPLEQGVGGQPVGTVHPRAGSLAGCPQTRQGARTVEVGQHPSRDVVGSRCDREPVDRRVEPDDAKRLGDRRETPVEILQCRSVEPQVVHARRATSVLPSRG